MYNLQELTKQTLALDKHEKASIIFIRTNEPTTHQKERPMTNYLDNYKKFEKNTSELRKMLIYLEILSKSRSDFFIDESICTVKNLLEENKKYMDEEFKKYEMQFSTK